MHGMHAQAQTCAQMEYRNAGARHARTHPSCMVAATAALGTAAVAAVALPPSSRLPALCVRAHTYMARAATMARSTAWCACRTATRLWSSTPITALGRRLGSWSHGGWACMRSPGCASRCACVACGEPEATARRAGVAGITGAAALQEAPAGRGWLGVLR